MNEELQKKLFAAFRAESREHIEYIRQFAGTVADESGAIDSAPLDDAYRRAHSLKGAARAVGLGPVEEVAHRLETLFSHVQADELCFDEAIARLVNRVMDSIEDGVTDHAEGRESDAITEIVESLEEILQNIGTPDAAPSQGADAVISEDESESTIPDADTRPAAIVEESTVPDSDIRPAAIVKESNNAPRGTRVPLQLHDDDGTVRVRIQNLDRLLRTSGQFMTEGMRQDVICRELREIRMEFDRFGKAWERTRKKSGRNLRRLSGDKDFDAVTNYLDVNNKRIQSISRNLRSLIYLQQESGWNLRHLSSQLHDHVRQIRVVPVEGVFHGFRRMVRDLAKDELKEIEFRTQGLEIEVDRFVLQELKDPIMHILRNAVNHGLEVPEERKAAGKSTAGMVTMRVESYGGRVHFIIEDDGRGLDVTRIAETAVKSGLISPATVDEYPLEEITALLFHPGFSTSKQVTNISGRGMGLSIVAEAVNKIQGGDVRISPRDGAGTRTVISVPLAISSHRLLLVTVKGQRYAIPVLVVAKVFRIDRDEISSLKGEPVININGDTIPLTSLAQILGLDNSVHLAECKLIQVLLLDIGEKRLAAAVDSVESEVEGIITDLGNPASGLTRFLGGIITGDGKVVPVLNPKQLTAPNDKSSRIVIEAPDIGKTVKHIPQVLVVDDSFTTRTLEKNILEANGFEVKLAVDGLDGLEKLKSEIIDLVIVDYEMPKMDGLTMVAEMKKDVKLKEIPVIIVSSIEDEETKRRGLSLGADAYIVKRKFDNEDLLTTIKQII